MGRKVLPFPSPSPNAAQRAVPPRGECECPPTADSHGGPSKQRNKQKNKQRNKQDSKQGSKQAMRRLILRGGEASRRGKGRKWTAR